MRSRCRARSRRSFACLREIVPCSSPSTTSSGWTCRHDAPSPSLRDGSATRRSESSSRSAATGPIRSTSRATFDETRFGELRLEPLSLGALAHLIRTRLDVRIPRPALARVHEASGGNPMFALEFARSLARQERAGARAAVDSGVAAGARPRRASPSSRRRSAACSRSPRPPNARPHRCSRRSTRNRRGCSTPPSTSGSSASAATASSASRTRCSPRRRTPSSLRRGAAPFTPSSPASRRTWRSGRGISRSPRRSRTPRSRPCSRTPLHAPTRAARPETAAELAQEAVRLTPLADVSSAGDREFAVAAYLADCRPNRRCLTVARPTARNRAARPAARTRIAAPGGARARRRSGARHRSPRRSSTSATSRRSAPRVLLRVELRRSAIAAISPRARRPPARRSRPPRKQTIRRFSRSRSPSPPTVHIGHGGHSASCWTARSRSPPFTALLPQSPTVRCLLGEQLLRDGDLSGARDVLERELRAVVGAGVEPARARILRDLTDVESHGGRLAARRAVSRRRMGDRGRRRRPVGPGRAPGEEGPARRSARRRRRRSQARRGRHQPRRGDALAAPRGDEPVDCSGSSSSRSASRRAPGRRSRDVARTPTWRGLEVVNALARCRRGTRRARPSSRPSTNSCDTLDDEARHGHRWAGPAALRSRALCLLARGDAAEAAALAGEAADAFEAAGFPLDRGRALLVAGEALRRDGRAPARRREARGGSGDLHRSRARPCGRSGPRRSCGGRGLDPGAIAS